MFMKKSFVFSGLLLVVFISILCYSCEKNNDFKPSNDRKQNLTNNLKSQLGNGKMNGNSNSFMKSSECSIENPVAFYSQKFATDSLFRVFINSIIDNHEFMFQNIKNTMGGCFPVYNNFVSSFQSITPYDHVSTLSLLGNYNADTAYLADRIAAIVTDGVFLYEENQCFFELTQEQQFQILSNVLSGTSYVSAKLEWGEFTACAVSSIAGFVASYGGVIGEVYRMLRHGTALLSWSDVWDIAKKIVRNAVPWWSVIGTLVQFGACLWSVW